MLIRLTLEMKSRKTILIVWKVNDVTELWLDCDVIEGEFWKVE